MRAITNEAEIWCDECVTTAKVVVEVGEEIDGTCTTTRLCIRCIRKAARLVEGMKDE